ncbi:FMN-binding protein [Clostridium sp. CS001]|uniref:FMN-binding protein n=1 Tax=Clostridium sp. CS001 TaxID=2880648 RepID=UPI001CF50680|nr:FMN-binding protein [Clostridium sp. CS001]MCB2288144.1 FMN-binding protein [Clostridium sp. CS001]
MKKNKLMTLIIAGVMTLSVLSGCGKKAEPTTPVVTPPAVETPAPVVTPPVAETPATPATYTASADAFDGRGWKAELTLTYEGDKITKIEYDEVNKDGLKKSADEGYATAMKADKGLTPAIVGKKLEETTLSDDKVTTVSGATTTSTTFKTLYEKAKAMKK